MVKQETGLALYGHHRLGMVITVINWGDVNTGLACKSLYREIGVDLAPSRMF